MDNVIFIVFGMAAATYIPRLIPFFLVGNTTLPRQVDAFLKCIPVAAIGALIIPGVFTAIPDKPLAVIGGMGFAFVIGWWKGGIIIPVLGSVAVAYLMLLLGV